MKPGIPQGTRDFSPETVRKRQYILQILKTIFEIYGYQPLETPAMENLGTLMGKYGEEGDRLIFKVLNNGLNNPVKHEKSRAAFEKVLEGKSTADLTERALRYDLTIPFARFVVMNQNELAFPFRRYQMQPVWRGDSPGKGRYREFWQCDCDVVGSNSLINEAELLCIYRGAFHRLGMPQVVVKINSRKLLAALAEVCGQPELLTDITVAMDKLDKIGWEGVREELEKRGIQEAGIATIKQAIEITGSNDEKLMALKELLGANGQGVEGIREIEETLRYHGQLADPAWASEVMVDISLARGLNYYTGIIAEVVCSAVTIGSIGGGGRYDDLTGLFGLKGLSGVGVSFGIDRTYDVLEELGLFPEQLLSGSRVMLVNFGGDNETYALQVLQQIRAAGIAAEIYPDAAKFDKQMKYANKRNIPFVILPGDTERESGKVSIKDFSTGQQQLCSVPEAIAALQA